LGNNLYSFKKGEKDIHEKDVNYLSRAEKIYLEIVKLFPKDFIVIECVPKKKLLSIEEIAKKVWKIVKKRID